jgi:hypothetical protein
MHVAPSMLDQHQQIVTDGDADGLPDSVEMSLATQFAPLILYDQKESNFPTNVETLLQNTSLQVYHADCSPENRVVKVGPLVEADLIGKQATLGCGVNSVVTSERTRSINKQQSFYLQDVPSNTRRGGAESSHFSTYFHAYPNANGGVTIQYWRHYAFNTGKQINILGQRVDLSHGGDWESVDVVLNSQSLPDTVRFPGHVHIHSIPWSSTEHSGDRLTIYVEAGGHQGHAHRPPGWASGVRHESWPGGDVTTSNQRFATGPLVNLGEKTHPFRQFIQYAGLWGSPGFNYFKLPDPLKELISATTGLSITNFTSGYWGPAYNETDMRADGFVTAWCAGHKNPQAALGTLKECFVTEHSQ